MFGAECFSYNKSLGEIFGARSIDNIFALANGIAKHLVCKCCMKMVWQNPKSRNAWTKTDLFFTVLPLRNFKEKKKTQCLIALLITERSSHCLRFDEMKKKNTGKYY